jgi:sulfate transport system permease protein
VALTFIGLPFVVRTVQPVIEDLNADLEEAAASLGASRWQILRRVIFPMLRPALQTGFALAFARALGEYGSVVFISGNMPMRTEISSLLIITKLEQYDYAGATAIAVVMLLVSFLLLFLINWNQARSHRFL